MRQLAACLTTALLVFGFFCSSFSAADANATVNVLESSNVFLTAFSVTPNSITQGASADFSVTAENRGNVEDALNASVSITNSTGSEVYVFNYSSVNVTPGSTVTLTRAWSSAGFDEGNYFGNATGLYGAANLTNSLIAAFAITSGATPTPTPGGGGGATPTPAASATPAALPTIPAGRPTTIPPRVVPSVGAVSFYRKTVLQEALAGESALLTLAFKNAGREAVAAKIVLSGLPAGAPPVPEQKIVLQPSATSSFDFTVWLPEKTAPGDYVVKISVVDDATLQETTADYFFLRVKTYPKDYENPIVLRSIKLDEAAKSTSVVLNLRNPSRKTLEVADVIEEIPPSLATSPNQIVFLDKIGSFISEAPLTIAWRLTQVEPDEKSVVSYAIKTLSEDYSVYGSWLTKQVTTTRRVALSDFVTITDFRIQSVEAGGRAKAGFSVFYGGLAPLQVTAALVLPPEFKASPQTISNVVLAPRTTQEFEFEIAASERVAAGAYSARAVVLALNEEVSSVGAVIVLPTGFSISVYLIGGAAFLVLALLAFLLWRKRGEPRFDRARLNYAASLRKIVFGEQ